MLAEEANWTQDALAHPSVGSAPLRPASVLPAMAPMLCGLSLSLIFITQGGDIFTQQM